MAAGVKLSFFCNKRCLLSLLVYEMAMTKQTQRHCCSECLCPHRTSLTSSVTCRAFQTVPCACVVCPWYARTYSARLYVYACRNSNAQSARRITSYTLYYRWRRPISTTKCRCMLKRFTFALVCGRATATPIIYALNSIRKQSPSRNDDFKNEKGCENKYNNSQTAADIC
jgi:hypothetical protein